MGWHRKCSCILLIEALAGYVMAHITLLFMPFMFVFVTFRKVGLIAMKRSR